MAGVLAIEKLAVRKTGLTYRVTIHVQADAELSLHDAHVLGGKVKTAIRASMPQVGSVLVHMEPYESRGSSAALPRRGRRLTRLDRPPHANAVAVSADQIPTTVHHEDAKIAKGTSSRRFPDSQVGRSFASARSRS